MLKRKMTTEHKTNNKMMVLGFLIATFNSMFFFLSFSRAESRATAESKIRNILCLKTALDLVPCLSEILRTAKSTLLINLRKVGE